MRVLARLSGPLGEMFGKMLTDILRYSEIFWNIPEQFAEYFAKTIRKVLQRDLQVAIMWK